MLGSGRWALLLLSLLRAAAGRRRLAPPRNVTLFSQDFGVYLTWLPGLDNPENVTYFVTYQGLPTPRRWQKVERCSGTRVLMCPLMCLEKQNLYTKFRGRVQAVSANAKSPKVESQYLEYVFEVEPAPPTLEFTWTEKTLRVNASYQLPPCRPPMDLKYEVELRAEGAVNKTLFPATPYGQPVHIPLKLRSGRRHCLRARTIYTTTAKYSRFSEPSCLLLEAPRASWAVLALLSLLPPLLVVAVGGVIWKSVKENPWFKPSRMPLALDFSGHRLPTVTWQPSGAESLDDVILCPPKDRPRRARLAPQVRGPPTGQAGTVESAEEDEDTDDSDSFHDYLSSPLFLAQALHPARPSGGTWIPPGPGPGSAAWDSSYGSSPSTGDSSFWEEAGSCSCVAEESAQGQRGDRGQDSVALLDSSEDSGSPEEPQKDDLSWWSTWGSPAPQQSLVPGEPPVSLQTFTFCWRSGPEEEEEWEEEEEESNRGSDPEDSSAGSREAEHLQKAPFKGGVPGHYLARILPG